MLNFPAFLATEKLVSIAELCEAVGIDPSDYDGSLVTSAYLYDGDCFITAGEGKFFLTIANAQYESADRVFLARILYREHYRPEALGQVAGQSLGAPLFKVGEIVCFTNDYGVNWHGCRVLSIDEPDQWGHRYYLEPSDAPWMYKRENNLTHEVLTLDQLKVKVIYNGLLSRHCEKNPGYLEEISEAIQNRIADSGLVSKSC